MSFNTPQSQIEAILQNILGATNDLLEPQSRNEELLLQILATGALQTSSFELIEEIEIEDSDVSSITRSDYDFTKVFIRARIAAGECGTIQTAVTIDDTSYNCGWWSENTSGGVCDTFARIENSMLFTEYGATMTASSGNNTTLVRREISYGQLVEGDITDIAITSSKYFPVGTVIEIYGVPNVTSTYVVTNETDYIVTE